VRLNRGIVFLVVLVSVLISFLLNNSIKSRENYMRSLPTYKHFRCTICHDSSNPTSSSDLNSFGIDFKNNNHLWNKDLAVKDSDMDGFTNGLELGDEDGDGIPEIGIERSNPGDPLNTPSSVDRETWGLIKSLFED